MKFGIATFGKNILRMLRKSNGKYHKSVLLKESIDALKSDVMSDRHAWYIDCTLGDGGHSIEIIKRGGQAVGIDIDPQALLRVQKRFQDLGIGKEKYKLIQGNFRDLKNLIQTEPKKFSGVLFDLGVSSYQLETPKRGFSFGKIGPLDMRMDPSLSVLAGDLVNTLSGKELYGLFKSLGEEKYSWAVAAALVRAREVKLFETTKELAEIIERAVGFRKGKIHPATRVFQALRIAVNDELDALQEGLDQAKDLIAKNGRIVVISFHSLEDRIVKLKFRKWQLEGLGFSLTKKPIIPSDDEIRVNPRSRSAKLRVFEKT